MTRPSGPRRRSRSRSAPTVTGLRREGFHRLPTFVILTFSQDMDRAVAQDVGNYRITGPMGGKGRGARAIPIRTASYDAMTRTVTLAPVPG